MSRATGARRNTRLHHFYLRRVAFPHRHVGLSAVTDLSLLEDLFNLKQTTPG